MENNIFKNGIKFQCQGSSNCCVSRGMYGYVYLSKKDAKNLHLWTLCDCSFGSLSKAARVCIMVGLWLDYVGLYWNLSGLLLDCVGVWLPSDSPPFRPIPKSRFPESFRKAFRSPMAARGWLGWLGWFACLLAGLAWLA